MSERTKTNIPKELPWIRSQDQHDDLAAPDWLLIPERYPRYEVLEQSDGKCVRARKIATTTYGNLAARTTWSTSGRLPCPLAAEF